MSQPRDDNRKWFSVGVPQELFDDLDVVCEQLIVSRSWVVIRALRDYLPRVRRRIYELDQDPAP